jgi:hypothetical protein
MDKTNFFEEYISKIAQKIDWLVTTCSSQYTNPVARENARNHLNSIIKEILTELYEVGYIAGKKEAGFNHDQRYRVDKFKMEKKLRTEMKKEILEIVLKEYGVKDEKNKSKIIKKVLNDEVDVEENN